MARTSVKKNMVKSVNYLNKDFSDFRDNLIEFAKVYFPNTYNDFNESSPGMMFIEMAAYVGDVLSYYTDHSFKENLLAHAEEKENLVSLAQGFGYKPQLVTPAICTVSMSALIPADSVGALDTKYLPRFSAGTSFTATTSSDPSSYFLPTAIVSIIFSLLIKSKSSTYFQS